MGLVTKEIMDSPITSITNRPVGAATHDTFIIVHYVREDMEAARTGSLGKMFHMDWQSLLLWQPELPRNRAKTYRCSSVSVISRAVDPRCLRSAI